MTDKDIQKVIKAINECFWRKDIGGVYICRGDIVPCMKHIEEGKCDTLKRLFAEERRADDNKRRSV